LLAANSELTSIKEESNSGAKKSSINYYLFFMLFIELFVNPKYSISHHYIRSSMLSVLKKKKEVGVMLAANAELKTSDVR